MHKSLLCFAAVIRPSVMLLPLFSLRDSAYSTVLVLFREHCPKSEFITSFFPKAFFLKKNKDHLLKDDRMKCVLIAVSLRAAAVEIGLDHRVFTSSSFWADSSQIWRTASWQR